MTLDLSALIEKARDPNPKTRIMALKQLRALQQQGVVLPPSAVTLLDQWDRDQAAAIEALRKKPAYDPADDPLEGHFQAVQAQKAHTQAEKDLQAGVVSYLEGLGFEVDQTFIGKTARGKVFKTVGTPDLFAARAGHQIWIELKTATGKTSEAQDQWHERFRRQGVCVVVCRSIYEVQEALREAGML